MEQGARQRGAVVEAPRSQEMPRGYGTGPNAGTSLPGGVTLPREGEWGGTAHETQKEAGQAMQASLCNLSQQHHKLNDFSFNQAHCSGKPGPNGDGNRQHRPRIHYI